MDPPRQPPPFFSIPFLLQEMRRRHSHLSPCFSHLASLSPRFPFLSQARRQELLQPASLAARTPSRPLPETDAGRAKRHEHRALHRATPSGTCMYPSSSTDRAKPKSERPTRPAHTAVRPIVSPGINGVQCRRFYPITPSIHDPLKLAGRPSLSLSSSSINWRRISSPCHNRAPFLPQVLPRFSPSHPALWTTLDRPHAVRRPWNSSEFVYTVAVHPAVRGTSPEFHSRNTTTAPVPLPSNPLFRSCSSTHMS
jgi:hypothetical protein